LLQHIAGFILKIMCTGGEWCGKRLGKELAQTDLLCTKSQRSGSSVPQDGSLVGFGLLVISQR